MKILVLNCGSSSIKYKLYNMDDKSVIAAGGIEKVGLEDSFLKTKSPVAEVITTPVPTHDVGVELIFKTLTDPQKGCIKSLDEINAVGHRIAHGGKFTKSLLLTPEVLAEWKTYESLAPLHNPAHLKGIEAVTAKLPEVKQVGVFDTSFHQTMPDYAYTYALPYEYYEKYGIRRYGFHGTSHRYVLARAAELFGFDPKDKNVISCHIGNGASIAAIKQGRCVDTTMGLTPTEGLMMGTRCGDVDPGALLFLMEKHNLNYRGMLDVVNKLSGVSGVTGISPDMREINAAAEEGDERAKLALDMYENRVIKYVGAFTAEMNGVDIIVFTGGVGEHQASIRANVCHSLGYMGVQVDEEVNQANNGEEQVISAENSSVKVVVIPTDEEYMIAKDTEAIVEGREP